MIADLAENCYYLLNQCNTPEECLLTKSICIFNSVALGISSAVDLLAPHVASRDDHRLIAKISMADCGGLSKMSANIEGCFRKYVGEAIERTKSLPSHAQFFNRFQECFSTRPNLPCGDWFTRTDVFDSTS